MWSTTASFVSNKSNLSGVQSTDFEEHLIIIQMWFIRSAWITRVKFVKDLLVRTKGFDVIGQILNMTRGNILKECIYIGAQYTTNNLFDKTLFDDDRVISSTTAYFVKEKDLIWFSKLSNSRQCEVLMALLRTGGGALMRVIYFYAYDIWNRRRNCNDSGLSVLTSLGFTENTINTTISYAQPSDSFQQYFEEKDPDNMFLQQNLSQNAMRFADITPLPIKVKNNRDVWEAKLKSIKKLARISSSKPIESQVTSQQFTTVSDKPKSKRKKKSSKINEEEKSPDEVNEENTPQSRSKSSLDYIQLLPIWINRRIISMLDLDSIKNARLVNKYWSALVDRVQDEMKTRRQLNRTISKLQKKRTKELKPSESNSTFDIIPSQNILKPKQPKSIDQLIEWRNLNYSKSKQLSLGKHSIVSLFHGHEMCKISVDTDRYLVVINSLKSSIFSLYSLSTGIKRHSELDVALVIKKISSFFLFADINKFFVGFENGFLYAYNLWSKQFMMKYPGHQSSIICISAVDDHIISCSNEQILVHDINTSLQLSKVNCPSPAHIVKAVHESDFYYAGYKNGELYKYSLHDDQMLACVIAHTGCVTAIEIDQIALVTSGVDNFVRIWDYSSMNDNECYRCLEHDSCIMCLSLCNNHIISGTKNSYVYIWNVISGLKLRTLDPFKACKIIPSYNMQIFSFCYLNNFKIIISKNSEVKILEFRQYPRTKVTPKYEDVSPKQARAVRRGTNIHNRSENKEISNLRLDSKTKRLALLNMRGCTDNSLRGNVGEENTIKSVPQALGARINSQSFARYSIAMNKHHAYTFPRCILDSGSTYITPCNIKRKELIKTSDKAVEKRFDKKSMLQVLHPYKISI